MNIDAASFMEVDAQETDGTPCKIGCIIERAGPMGSGSPPEDCVMLGSPNSLMSFSELKEFYPYSHGSVVYASVCSIVDITKPYAERGNYKWRRVTISGAEMNRIIEHYGIAGDVQ